MCLLPVAGGAAFRLPRRADGHHRGRRRPQSLPPAQGAQELRGTRNDPRYADEVITTAQAFPVDAVLAEGAVPGIVIGAFATGLPTAALMPNIYLRPTAGFPLLGTGWRPGRGAIGRARDRLAPKAAQGLPAPGPSPHQRGADRLCTAALGNQIADVGQYPSPVDLEYYLAFQLRPQASWVRFAAVPSFPFNHAPQPKSAAPTGPRGKMKVLCTMPYQR